MAVDGAEGRLSARAGGVAHPGDEPDERESGVFAGDEEWRAGA